MDKLITKIEKGKLIDLIKSFYNLTGIKVAVYDSDFSEILAFPESDSRFCTIMHKNKLSCEKCSESMRTLCSKCAVKQKVIIEKCHAGLTEVIAPLTDGISVMGYIMFGQIRREKDDEIFFRCVADSCMGYCMDNAEFTDSLRDIRYYSEDQLRDASKILNALAVYIVSDKMIYIGSETAERKIVEYIMNNTEKDLSVSALCKAFYMSKSELYKITARCMPGGVATFVKNARLSKAAALLRCTDKSIWEICEETGFSDVNYFLRVFKKEKGVSASKWRNKR